MEMMPGATQSISPRQLLITTILALLLIQADAQDIAESTLSKFEGEEAQLICPEADTSTKPASYGYDWYKDRYTGTQSAAVPPNRTTHVALYQVFGGFLDGPHYRNDLSAAGRATLDTDDASLTIHQLQLSDDSWYGCEVINQNGNIRLNVNVHPSQPSISVSGTITEGMVATLTCTVDRIKPNTAIITWGIRGSSSPSSRGNTVEELLDSTTNVYKMVDTWSHQFTRDDHNKEVECKIIPQIDQSPSKTTHYTLNVLYTYQTSVIKSDSNQNPVRGQAFSLRCNSVTDGNPATVSNYKWSKDGSNLIGEVGSQLTFDPVTEADNGEYKCYIKNSVGWTLDERTAAYNLQVWYVPSITSHPQGQTLPAGGSVTFTCTADYFPDQQVSTQWLKADTDIPGETGATYTISQVKKTDRGDYKCKFCNVVGCTNSNEATLSVLYGPEGIPESSVGAEVHKTGDTVRFDCDISSLTDQGNPAVTWIEWTHNVITKQKESGTKYEFTSSSVLESGEYRCRAGNSYGESSYSQQTTLTIEAPVKIEFPEPGEGEVTETFQLGTEQNSEVKMSCTASGSDIDHISWHRNDTLVSDGEYDVASSDVTGQYSYDQTSGKMSELRWKHGDSPSCEEAGRVDGTYYCTAYGDAAAAPGTDQSVNFNIQLQYPAIWNGDTLMQTAASLGDKNVQIKCPVCANPPPSKYVWTVNGTSVRGNITEEDDTITIDTVQDSDFTSYTCKVENNMDGGLKSSTFKIELIEKGQPRQPRGFTVVTGKVTSAVIGLQWMAGFDGGYPPLSYELQYNILGESNIMVLPQEEFDQHEGTYSVLLHPLQPNTVYEIQVRSRNSRPPQEGGNASPWASLQYSTYESPEVSLTSVDVKDDQMTVIWDYEGRRKRELSNLEVTVQILYRESGSGDYTQDPTKTPATQRQQKVQGQFSTSLKYDVKLRVYEGDIPLASQDTKEYTTQIKMKEASVLPIIIGCLAGVLVVLVLIGGFVIFRKRRSQKKKGSDLELHNTTSSGLVANGWNGAGSNNGVTNPALDVSVDSNTNPSDGGAYAEVGDYRGGVSAVVGDYRDKNNGRMPEGSARVISIPGHSQQPEPLYAEVSKPKASPPPRDPSSLYAQVDKTKKQKKELPREPPQDPSSLYADVDKSKKKPKPDGRPTDINPQSIRNSKRKKEDKKKKKGKKDDEDANLYANVNNPDGAHWQRQGMGDADLYQNVGEMEQQPEVGPDGIVYADLNFKDKTKAKGRAPPSVIRREQESTEYADIDFTKKAPPVQEDASVSYVGQEGFSV